ncbi:unnamed protein product [Phytomonas sp. Hart1]|nr:unnamed protein product [Phytomonas sp. Hart1]|eukprot:CCW69536.1 unnamed protein product [Phytomonas sp. isolate Hart1]
MEGNFYISDIIIDFKLGSNYSIAYEHCKEEALSYGKCMETSQINRSLSKNLCLHERQKLRQCIDNRLRSIGKKPLPLDTT